MHATIRRYEGVDESRIGEIKRTVEETLIPRLSELPGFSGYFLLEPANGVLTSISLFETMTQADESTRVAAKVVEESKLREAMPNAPKTTFGKLIAHTMTPELTGV